MQTPQTPPNPDPAPKPPYRGQQDDRRYAGETMDITFSVRRCIHAELCVHRLASVFDASKRPWIDPKGATGDEAVAVISDCPSGALHVQRKDGGAAEQTPAENTAQVWPNGPVQVRGNLLLSGSGVQLEGETRVTLCRCGASKQKPFCDNSHKQSGFDGQETAPTIEAREQVSTTSSAESVTFTVAPNGPVRVRGALTITTSDGRLVYAGDEGSKTALCRCGASSNKPFCDGTHVQVGFVAE